MSVSIVTREQAEKYANENNVTLLEARDVLLWKRIKARSTGKNQRLIFDKDGFYTGTEKMPDYRSYPHKPKTILQYLKNIFRKQKQSNRLNQLIQ